MKINKKNHTTKKIKPEAIILLGFLVVILIGTLLLTLPLSSSSGKWTDPVTALFTAATCTCVTGLTVVDTFSYWSLFGKVIILLLIQTGGFGVVTLTTGLLILMKKRITLEDRLILESAFNLDNIHGLVRFMIWVVKGTFLVEGIGALLSLPVFVPEFGLKGIWISVFHSISAFCNAGIDIIGSSSLAAYSTNIWLNLVTMLLIILGGLGFLVWKDLTEMVRRRFQTGLPLKNCFHHLSLHSKITLTATGFFIISGALLFLLLEWNNPATIGGIPGIGARLTAGFFQSVTTRTAGFFTFSQADMRPASFLVSSILMFVGGSSIGTAGGVKTSTVFLMVLATITVIRGNSQITAFKRGISKNLIFRAIAIITISMLTLLSVTTLLCVISGDSLSRVLYETASALATVGLSCGVTGELGVWGHLILIVCMYLGRVGPISLAIAFSDDKKNKNYLLPEQNITIG